MQYDPPLPGHEQMRRDQHYYSCFDPSRDLPLLRFYTWQSPTVSLGRFQTLTPEWAERLQSLGLPTVQRPTGGKAILHAGDLTFSLIGPLTWLPGNLLTGHALIRQALQTGLQQLGIDSTGGLSPARRQQSEHCFATATPADIQSHWGKLVGTAQVRRRQAFLVQGTLYLEANRPLLQAVFSGLSGSGEPSDPDSEIMDLAQLLGKVPTQHQVITSLADGFRNVFQLVYSEAGYLST